MKELTKVFVYGSLKKGLFLNWALEQAQFLGEFKTELGYDMFAVAHSGVFPILTLGDYKVSGEVYEVDDFTLHMLDQIEGGYDRLPIKIDGIKDTVYAYFYFYGKPKADAIHLLPTKNILNVDGVKSFSPPEMSHEELVSSGLVKTVNRYDREYSEKGDK